jgi:two-component system, sensor histidine kinase and response regulator
MNYDATFLVVGNMEGMRRILGNILKRLGMKNILLASNGLDSWHLLQTQPIDIVLSDWKMFDMSGEELLRKIRASSHLASIPVLMMAAESEQAEIEDAGAQYIAKPFNMVMLENKIQTLVEQLARRPTPTSPTSLIPAVRLPENSPTRSASYNALVKASAASAASAAGSTGNTDDNIAEKPTLLVVDDIADNLDILVELLGNDYVVRVANSGERALKVLGIGKLPDLILLDVMMPDMDGFQVCQQIKMNPATADIPVIFLSTMTESVDLAKGFEVGAVDFITKPADPPILCARIATHIKLLRSFEKLKQSQAVVLAQNTVLEENLRLHEEVERIAQHDLKNPIACIIGFAAILQDEPLLREEHKDIVGYIEQSAYSALNMVNLSLDLYKMERGGYNFQPVEVDLVKLLQRIIKEKAPEISSRKQRVEFFNPNHAIAPMPPIHPVLADELLCYSMFGNLLKNAMEAARPNTVVQLVLQPESGQIKIHITNDGVVPKEVRALFFEKFSTAGKQGGTGLGTFSARLIAQTQGGDIAMQTSDDKHCTTVTVSLPCVPAMESTQAKHDER